MYTNAPFKKVLIIDDNEIDLYVANRVLFNQNFANEVVSRDSGQEGLKYLESLILNSDELPEVIFLDVRMPLMDGFEFLEQFDQLPRQVKEHCSIIMLSSSLDKNDHYKAWGNKYVKGFVNKPLRQEKLSSPEFIKLIPVALTSKVA